MSATARPDTAGGRAALLEFYDDAVVDVYGYFHRRCRHRSVAEDLTTETFLAAVDSIERGVVETVTVAWLVGIARHKLVDHWRRTEREQRRLAAVGAEPDPPPDHDWDVHLDALATQDVLDDLGEHHRSVLTLRYVDDLPVADVARLIDRTLHATEALLVRARRAFRTRYEEVTR
ncbi:MAG: RNA polymerase sigma factor [Ilumatobacter sp.]|uniref:RNA polymerase sigma factor n=1 Tax=Ilumatobacter sp. TaxID=1967498 RepID=UPI003C7852C9